MTTVINKPVQITLTPDELNVVIGALELAPMPHRSVHPVIVSIGKQVAEQIGEKKDGQKPDSSGAQDGRGQPDPIVP